MSVDDEARDDACFVGEVHDGLVLCSVAHVYTMMYNHPMKRTNIYLDEQELKLLKHLAVEERSSLAALVRRAVRWYLAVALGRVKNPPRQLSDAEWSRRLDALLAAVRARLPALPPDAIEADITAAREEVRQAHRYAPPRRR